MKHNTMLTVVSLLSLLLLTLHITDDIVRGISKAEPSNIALAVLVLLLYGTLVLAERRAGHVIHAARRVVRGSHARHAHEGGTLRRDRQVHRRLLFRLDTLGARRARGRHFHPLGARPVESATGTAKMRTVRKKARDTV